ncbi:GDSL-type esterase/lipase family protein [Gallibacterium melopsittaci]|uniref:GDSL-type esterase/lipase family protein n=1 Tax=Gallibacterium melopsittaci TaxID=516063 RepID=A0ABV6HTM2_9PAST
MKRVALIPVRSTEQADIPNKNVLMLEGKLVAGYTIETVLQSGCFDKIVVLTDKLEYQDALSHYAVELQLCETATLMTEDALVTAWQTTEALADEYQIIAIFAPEMPLRSVAQIQQAVELFEQQQVDELYTVNPQGVRNPSILLKRLSSQVEPIKTCHYTLSKEASLYIEDSFEYEIVKALLQLRVRYQTSLLNVKRRIAERKPDFQQVREITLVGHSLWDYWQIEQLNDIPVNNLGIGGITTQQYVELILQPQMIKGLGKYTLIFLGINEMCRPGWRAEDTLYWLDQTIQHLKQINPATQLYLMEVSYMAFKRECSNAEIDLFNHQLRQHFADKGVTLIASNSVLQDGYRKLDLAFTDDGLHFNQVGYGQLSKLLIQTLFAQ